VTGHGITRYVSPLNLADAFVTFFALLGPQKILVPVARMTRARDPRCVRLAVSYGAVVAAGVGVVFALTAPWIATFFHITSASMELAAGVVFFIYAIGLVFGLHFGENAPHDGKEDEDARHPISSGFRELLLPLIVSPLGVAAVLEESLTAAGWGDRWVVASAYVAVVAVDLITALTLAPLMRRAEPMSLEVLSRLLGILLSAVGVTLFLHGLSTLGVHLAAGH
jgi:multiple antibiotic resistance protein